MSYIEKYLKDFIKERNAISYRDLYEIQRNHNPCYDDLYIKLTDAILEKTDKNKKIQNVFFADLKNQGGRYFRGNIFCNSNLIGHPEHYSFFLAHEIGHSKENRNISNLLYSKSFLYLTLSGISGLVGHAAPGLILAATSNLYTKAAEFHANIFAKRLTGYDYDSLNLRKDTLAEHILNPLTGYPLRIENQAILRMTSIKKENIGFVDKIISEHEKQKTEEMKKRAINFDKNWDGLSL